MKNRHFLTQLAMILVIVAVIHIPISADDIIVTTCDFESLQSAVERANVAGGTITFDCEGVIYFMYQLEILGNVTINGNRDTIFDGRGLVRFVEVDRFASLTLNGLILQNGYSSDFGGAIDNSGGKINIYNSTFINNVALYGGAISNNDTIVIVNTMFLDNRAEDGGAIYNYSGKLSISNSVFKDNSTTDTGGAINNYGGSTLELTNNLFINNFASVYGGAIDSLANTIVIITRNTFINNSTNNSGGALSNYNGTFDIFNNTFINNSAYYGSFIHNRGDDMMGILNIRNNTIIGSSSYIIFDSDGLFSPHNAISTLKDNILYSEELRPICFSANNTLMIDQTNLTNVTCGDALVVDNMMLGEFNGFIVPLLPNSPAIDAYPAPCATTTDQLGTPRPQGGGCDIGAVEFVP
jgi:hypothetical protein